MWGNKLFNDIKLERLLILIFYVIVKGKFRN